MSPARVRPWWILAAIVAGFFILRVPLMHRQAGGQDEDWFAVPGYTVYREGIPRVPFAPERNPESVFYGADEALLVLPPAYFYWQAPFHLVLPPGFGTSRFASGIAGAIAVCLVYLLGKRFFGDETAALWGAGLYSVSRLYYFPAFFARPDMLCTMFGLAALLAAWRWSTRQTYRAAALAGVLLGLGMLTHPFAIVYCVQVGVWVLVGMRAVRLPGLGGAGALAASRLERQRMLGDAEEPPPLRKGGSEGRMVRATIGEIVGRLLPAAVLVGCALAVFALWLPLILAHPDLFEAQFVKNVLTRSGPGVLERLVMPWEPLVYHGSLLLHAGPLQLVLMFGGLLLATVHDGFVRRHHRLHLVLAWSAVYLLIAIQGAHPSAGYWSYPAALLFLCAGRSVSLSWAWLSARVPRKRLLAWCGGALLAAMMIPGSGIRTWIAHVRHWSDPNYRRSEFVQQMLSDLPPEARYTVDPAYVYDFYLAGRKTTLGVNYPFYFMADRHSYEYYVCGRYGFDNDIPRQLGGEPWRTYGDRDDLFACYAVIFRPEEFEEITDERQRVESGSD